MITPDEEREFRCGYDKSFINDLRIIFCPRCQRKRCTYGNTATTNCWNCQQLIEYQIKKKKNKKLLIKI
jgi:hypothetical protein